MKKAGKTIDDFFGSDGSLSNCFEFYEEYKKKEEGNVKSLLFLEINRVLPLLESIDFKRALPYKTVFVLIVLLFIEFTYLVFILGGSQNKINKFDVFPKNVTVLEGSSIELGVRSKKRFAHSVKLFFKDKNKLKSIVLKRDHKKYSLSIPVKRKIDYWFVSGNQRSADYNIDVVKRLRMIKMNKSIIYPEYIGKIEASEDNKIEEVVLLGSKISYDLKLNEKASSIDVKYLSNEFEFENTSEIKILLNANRSGEVTINAVNCLSRLVMTGEIRVIPDKSPKIDVILPLDGSIIDPDQPLILKYRVEDDYGLSYTDFVLRSDGFFNSEEIVTNGTYDYIERRFKLPEKDFSYNSTLKIKINAKDKNPDGLTISRSVVVFFADKFKRISDYQKGENSISDDILRLEKHINRVSKSIDREVSKNQDESRLKDYKLEQNLKNIKKETKALLDRLSKSSIKNSQYSEEIIKKIRKIKEIFRSLTGEHISKEFKGEESKSSKKIDDELMLKKLDKMLSVLKALQKEKNIELLSKAMSELLSSKERLNKEGMNNALNGLKDMLKSEYPKEYKDFIDDLKKELVSLNSKSEHFKEKMVSTVKNALEKLNRLRDSIAKKRKDDITSTVKKLIMQVAYFRYRFIEYKSKEEFLSDFANFYGYFRSSTDDISLLSQKSFLFPETAFIMSMRLYREIKLIRINDGSHTFEYQKKEFCDDSLRLVKILIDFFDLIKDSKSGSKLQEFRNSIKEIMKMQQDAMKMLQKMGEDSPKSLWEDIMSRQQGISEAFQKLGKYGSISQEIMRKMEQISRQMAELNSEILARSKKSLILNKQKNTNDNLLKLDRAIKKIKEIDKKREAERTDNILYSNTSNKIKIPEKSLRPLPYNEINKLPKAYKEIYFYILKNNKKSY